MTAPLVSRKSQLFLLGFLTGIFLVNFLSRVILAPLMPVIERCLAKRPADRFRFEDHPLRDLYAKRRPIRQ